MNCIYMCIYRIEKSCSKNRIWKVFRSKPNRNMWGNKILWSIGSLRNIRKQCLYTNMVIDTIYRHDNQTSIRTMFKIVTLANSAKQGLLRWVAYVSGHVITCCGLVLQFDEVVVNKSVTHILY